jgi:hypothetical protein
MTLDDAYAPPLHAVLSRGEGFGHRQHLELAWRYLNALPAAEAERAMTQAIAHLAAEHGTPDRYHATMTLAWVRLVDLHRAHSRARCFDDFIAEHAGLLDRTLLKRHYSDSLMSSDAARRTFVAPDVRALPGSV